jgi:hypothetical protein
MKQQIDVGMIGDLQYATLKDAKVFPGAVTSTNGSVRGGVAPFGGAPQFISQLRQVGGNIASLTRFRHGDPTGFGPPGEQPAYYSGTYVYLGPIHRHFGHFVTESMTRIWYSLLASTPNLEVVVLPEVDSVEERENFSFDKLSAWQQDILRYFGIERLHFVRSTSIFESLIVPQQGGILFSQFHSETYLDILTAHSDKALGKTRTASKVFYLRPDDVPHGKVAGQEYIGKFLSECGYLSVYPELLSGTEQIRLAASASKVISSQGSALHAFNLLGRCEADVLVLQRSTASVMSGFINTVEPYVGSVTIHEPALNVPGGVNSWSGLQMIDVERFLLQLTEFDESIDPKIFDHAAYYRAVLADMQAFTRSISK